MSASSDMTAVVEALRGHDRFVVSTHENPDGDALGSLLAMTLGLRELGKDAVMYLSGDMPLPDEFGFMGLAEIARDVPADASQRVLVAVDSANARRLGSDEGLLERFQLTLDIDHHHDNTRYGGVNLIVGEASSCAEIVHDVLAELGVPLTPPIADALYVGLVTDTGRFQYSNTTPKALRLAAELLEAGVDGHEVFQHVYESVEFAKLKLLGRALANAELFEGGRLVISHLDRSDFVDAGAQDPYSEGIIDYLRQVEGAELVALIREPLRVEGPIRRVSLRSSTPDVDVSAIARKSEGGGHKQAAGFSNDGTVDEIAEFIREEFLLVSPAPA